MGRRRVLKQAADRTSVLIGGMSSAEVAKYCGVNEWIVQRTLRRFKDHPLFRECRDGWNYCLSREQVIFLRQYFEREREKRGGAQRHKALSWTAGRHLVGLGISTFGDVADDSDCPYGCQVLCDLCARLEMATDDVEIARLEAEIRQRMEAKKGGNCL